MPVTISVKELTMNNDICFCHNRTINAGPEAHLALVDPSIVQVCLEETQGAVPKAVEGEDNSRLLNRNVIFEPQGLQLIKRSGCGEKIIKNYKSCVNFFFLLKNANINSTNTFFISYVR